MTFMGKSWEMPRNWVDKFEFKLHASGLQEVAQVLVWNGSIRNAYLECSNQDGGLILFYFEAKDTYCKDISPI